MKKTQIIHTAFQLFTEKGYAATSIQEIVSICKMSKATFYHYFSSKKELFYELLQFRDELFESQLQVLDQETSPNIRFRKQTELYIESLHTNRTLFLLAPFVVEQEEFIELEKGIKRFKIKTYKRLEFMLSSVFKLNQQSNRWDIVLLYDALIREYVEIGSYHSEYLDIPYAAQCVEQYLDLLVENEMEPMLSSELMEKLTESNHFEEKACVGESRLAYILISLEEKLNQIYLSEIERTAFIGNLDMLKEKLEEEQPQLVIISSILGLFELKSELVDIVNQMKKVIGEEKGLSI